MYSMCKAYNKNDEQRFNAAPVYVGSIEDPLKGVTGHKENNIPNHSIELVKESEIIEDLDIVWSPEKYLEWLNKVASKPDPYKKLNI